METLGQFLKREREFRKISLDELSKATKLSIATLKKIETDQYDQVFKGAYLKGYLRTYALAVGISLDEVMNRYYLIPTEYQKVEDPLKGDDLRVLKDGILPM